MSITHNKTSKSNFKSAGFTLVEIVVVAPIVVLVIAGILAVLINFISSNSITNEQLSLTNEVNGSLGDMETTLGSAQSFASSVSSSLGLQNSNSSDYSSQPRLIGITADEVGTGNNISPAQEDCTQPLSSDNLRPTATIYYLDSSQNLKLRVLTKSATPCGGTSVNPKNCRAFNITSSCINDKVLATNVTNFTVKYCIDGSCSTGNNPTSADSVNVSITASKTVAGKQFTHSNSLRISPLEQTTENTTITCPYGTTSYTDQQVTGTTSGSVWGTDIYTADSNVGKAAVHVGLITSGQTATIRVCSLPGQSSYTGSTRNGVTTSSYGSWGNSYSLLLVPTCPSSSTSYTDEKVTGSTSGSVWGTDIYTSDSNVGKAAVHAGLLSAGETATVRVCSLPGQSSYTGSTRNGVTTSSWGSWGSSYSLVFPP